METLGYKTTLRIVKLLNPLLVTVPFGVCWYLCYADRVAQPYYNKGNWIVIALFFVLYITYGRIYDGFRITLNRIYELIGSQTLACVISDVLLYIVTWLLTKHIPPVWPILLMLVCQVLVASIWSLVAHRWYFSVFPPKKTAVIYDQREGLEQLISSYGLDIRFQVEQTADVQTALRGNLEILNGVQAVFLCGIHSHERNIILKRCIAQGVQVYLIPRIGDVLMSGAQRMHMFHLPMLRVERYAPNPEYVFIKRAFDILVSGVALVVLSPLMLAVALAIRSDGGPALYKQCRLTKNGKKFNVLKFRSMRVDAEKDGVARLSTGDKDDRITPVGHFIRKCRLDELPQLINILRGDMSLVGPRPERPEIAAQYEEELPEFALRLQAKAGLTGYAQVYGKYNTTPYDKLQMDLMYIANPSFAEDIKIMFATVKILFESESTEGVEEGQTTANEMREPKMSV